MPIIDMPVESLLDRIAAGEDGVTLSVDELVETLPKLGVEIEELADLRQYTCTVCEKIFDRSEAQGAPLHCTHCGADFRAAPAQLGDLGPSRILRLSMNAVRPDIFDAGGMSRFIRGYLGVQTGLPEYTLQAPRLRVAVDPRLAQDESYRPFISCAVVRNVKLDHASIKLLMNLQEDLHWALGRNRKLASIGVYDLDTLKGDTFHYDSVDPDELRFVPLGFDPKNPASAITPREILEKHKTGQEFAHLLKPLKRYPLLRDGVGTVLSMPPIINSESTRVTMKTRNFFVDVTGLSPRTVDRALNILVTNLKEVMPEILIESVIIEDPQGTGNPGAPAAQRAAVRTTPDLAPQEFDLDVDETCATIGVELNAGELGELLESMGHGVSEGPAGGLIHVTTPAYRNDIMHPIDLIEDVAVAFGYDHLDPSLLPAATLGKPREIEELSGVARRILVGLGFHQVMTLVLTSEPAAFGKARVAPDPRAVQIENPISVEQTICRVSLVPGILETLAINKQYDLPQQLFEVGDCCFVDAASETGAREERYAAAAMIGTHVGYADIRAVADAFVHELGASYIVKPVEHASFIPGRAAGLHTAAGEWIGTMGELHPEVLENYGLKHPVAVFELNLAKLLA